MDLEQLSAARMSCAVIQVVSFSISREDLHFERGLSVLPFTTRPSTTICTPVDPGAGTEAGKYLSASAGAASL